MFSEKDRRLIRERLAPMTRAVKLVHFTQELECPLCAETRMTLEQIADLADLLTLEVHDVQRDVPVVAAYGIDMIPATVIECGQRQGIRFFGLPAGYMLAELLETIAAVSRGRSELKPATVATLGALDRRVHLQVLVTPT